MSSPSQWVAELLESRFNARILRHFAGDHDAGTELGGEFFHPPFQLVVLVGESQFRAFAVHGGGDAVSDGTVTCDPGNECAFASQKTHVNSCCVNVML